MPRSPACLLLTIWASPLFASALQATDDGLMRRETVVTQQGQLLSQDTVTQKKAVVSRATGGDHEHAVATEHKVKGAHKSNGAGKQEANTSSKQLPVDGAACSTNKKFEKTGSGGQEWQQKCMSLQSCQANCTALGCSGFNWWPTKGGCRVNNGAVTATTVSWTCIGGARDCTSSWTNPSCAECPSFTNCRQACTTTKAYRGDKINIGPPGDGTGANKVRCNTLTECQTRCTDFTDPAGGSLKCVGFNYWPSEGKCRLWSAIDREEDLDSSNQKDYCVAGRTAAGSTAQFQDQCTASGDDSTPLCQPNDAVDGDGGTVDGCSASDLAAGAPEAPSGRTAAITCRPR